MQSELSCPLCNFEYCEQKTPRILSMCGHTFCETCIQTLIIPQGEDKFKIICPEDDATSELPNDSLKQFPINKVLLKIVQSNKSKSSFKDSSFDVSKIVKQQELQEDEQTKQLISAIQQSQQQESELTQKSGINNPNNTTQVNNSTAHTVFRKEEDRKEESQSSEQEDQNICLLHQKPLEVVCVVDLEKICAKCAIFGKHKGHDFKSLQQIQQQNNAFYQQLLAVYDQKTVILHRVEKKETKADILAILNANKQNLTKQVKQRFKKLLDTIKHEQKKAISKLDKFAQKIQKDIDQLYNIEPALVQKYEQWQRHSFEKLQIIEKGTFEQKLQLLLVDQANADKNIIIQGKALVDQIKTQQDAIITKAEVFLTNINMKTNDKIFEFVESFVEIYDKPPQAPKIESQKIEQQNLGSKNRESLMFDSGKKHSEDDLLEVQEHTDDPIVEQKIQNQPNLSKTAKKQEAFRVEQVKFVPILPNKLFEQKPTMKHELRAQTKRSLPDSYTIEDLKKKVQISQQTTLQNTSKQDSFATDKLVRPPKKKLKTIKVPQKYEKILEGLYADNSQTLDLTNAELGDSVILQICEFIPGTKLKTIKFIRNKLTDDCILKMLPYFSHIITLNLSQNLLTERVLDIFIENRQLLPKVKNIILSLNKIIERKHKNKIDELRKLDITVSV